MNTVTFNITLVPIGKSVPFIHCFKPSPPHGGQQSADLLVQSFSHKRRAFLAGMFSLITRCPFWRQRCGASLWTGITTSRCRC